MQLSRDETLRFFRLHQCLSAFVNRRLDLVPDAEVPEAFQQLSAEERGRVRNAWVSETSLIEQYAEQNPDGLSGDDLAIVRSWTNLVAGRFLLVRQLKKHMVFLTPEEPARAYGVLALSESFDQVVGPTLPQIVETLLLPFGDKIVYDGYIRIFNMTFGGGAKRSINESYRQAKERQGGLITTLPPRPASTAKRPTARKRKTRSKSDAPSPDDVRRAREAIVERTDAFCREHLNEEYAELARKLAEKLARKRPSPLPRGKPAAWASGIVRAIGWVNFLPDPASEPHMPLYEIDAAFGVSQSTGAARLKQIRDALKLTQLDPGWTLPSMADENPRVWMVEINGLLLDLRNAPRDLQERAFEEGLIPYVPKRPSGSR